MLKKMMMVNVTTEIINCNLLVFMVPPTSSTSAVSFVARVHYMFALPASLSVFAASLAELLIYACMATLPTVRW